MKKNKSIHPKLEHDIDSSPNYEKFKALNTWDLQLQQKKNIPQYHYTQKKKNSQGILWEETTYSLYKLITDYIGKCLDDRKKAIGEEKQNLKQRCIKVQEHYVDNVILCIQNGDIIYEELLEEYKVFLPYIILRRLETDYAYKLMNYVERNPGQCYNWVRKYDKQGDYFSPQSFIIAFPVGGSPNQESQTDQKEKQALQKVVEDYDHFRVLQPYEDQKVRALIKNRADSLIREIDREQKKKLLLSC